MTPHLFLGMVLLLLISFPQPKGSPKRKCVMEPLSSPAQPSAKPAAHLDEGPLRYPSSCRDEGGPASTATKPGNQCGAALPSICLAIRGQTRTYQPFTNTFFPLSLRCSAEKVSHTVFLSFSCFTSSLCQHPDKSSTRGLWSQILHAVQLTAGIRTSTEPILCSHPRRVKGVHI